MTGAGRDAPDRPSAARRIADAWGMRVEAPEGSPLFVPGGSFFVPPRPGVTPTTGGWLRFTAGADPEPLGPRSPEPFWQSAVCTVPTSVPGGSVVEQIPAGLVIRPVEAAGIKAGDLYHAVPVDPRRPAVVIGVPYGEDVSVDEVLKVLRVLPPKIRARLRLVPGGLRDVLPLAQSAADRLDVEVEVMTGLPLIAMEDMRDSYATRAVIAAADGSPQWMPFIDAVLCRPMKEDGTTQAPRLLRWRPPLPGPAKPEAGAVELTDQWQVTVTRAGLWVGARDGSGPSPTARSVDVSGPVIELGRPGEVLGASLWPELARLLAALTPGLRTRAMVQVHGRLEDGGRELRRLASQYGLRTLRYSAPGPPAGRAAHPARESWARPSAAPPLETGLGHPPAPLSPSATSSSQQPRSGKASTPVVSDTESGRLRDSPRPEAPASIQHPDSPRTDQLNQPRRPVHQPVPPVSAQPEPDGHVGQMKDDGERSTAQGAGTSDPLAGHRESPELAQDSPTSVFDWSDDAVPLGSLGRARRRGEARGRTDESPAGARAPGPDELVAAKRAQEPGQGIGSAVGSTTVWSATTEDLARATHPEGERPAPHRSQQPTTASGGMTGEADPAPSGDVAEPAETSPSEKRTRPVTDSEDDRSYVSSNASVPRSSVPTGAAIRVPTDGDGEVSTSEPGTMSGAAPRPAQATGGGDDRGGRAASQETLDGARGSSADSDAMQPFIPFEPGHHSTDAERAAFLTLAAGAWERHGAAVRRALDRIPALRGMEQDAARVDMTALRIFLHGSEERLSHGALTQALRRAEPAMLPYGACVASALYRLPSYRGVLLRGMGFDLAVKTPHMHVLPRPGTVLRDAAPLSAMPLDPTRSAVPGGSYVIWSVAGRRVRQVADEMTGPDEVVFAPGTCFRVLAVRGDGPNTQIFLRELTGSAVATTSPDLLADRDVLARLDNAVHGRTLTPASSGMWPARCTGAVGAGP
ncbi:hypothetical protein SUDANB66_06490 (plasmid) [Streptomyces sp. SudanB66_2053]